LHRTRRIPSRLEIARIFPKRQAKGHNPLLCPDYVTDRACLRAAKKYAPDVTTEKTIEFLRRKHDRPFLLFVTCTMPHASNELGHATGNGMDVPAGSKLQDEKSWPAPERGFAAMMERLDGYVGCILGTPREAGLDNNTLVVFSSDNGPHREGGHNPDHFQSRGPLRGMKRDLYEGGIRVPFLARWPGRIEAGRTTESIVMFQDVMPTFAELAGTKPPSRIDGRSFAQVFRGTNLPAPQYLYWNSMNGDSLRTFAWATGKG
jgi:arylsulfatase A-like enzyme